jgi:hypothetical protein
MLVYNLLVLNNNSLYDVLIKPDLSDSYLAYCGKVRRGLRPAGAAAKDTQASMTL